MNNNHYLELLSDYITIIDIVNLNKLDNNYFLNNNILYKKSIQKIVNFLQLVKRKRILSKEISNDENLYFNYTTTKYKKKLLIDLYFETYSNEYRLSWYNQNNVSWKKMIVDKYKKGEFANKTSLSKYEFYRFQLQFTNDEIEAIGY